MSFYSGTQTEVLFSGPPANYTAAAASSSSAQSLVAGATGNYQQPLLPGGFWQQGRQGQLVSFEFSILLSCQSSATTTTIIAGLDTAANTIGGSTLLTYPALTTTSYSSGSLYGAGIIQNRGSGYGTSSVATNLLSSGWLIGTGNSATVSGAAGPTALQTIDFSVNQWFYLTVTFSTSSASNSATLESLIVRGEN